MHDSVLAAITDGDCNDPNRTVPIVASDFYDAPAECLVTMSVAMNKIVKRTLPASAFTVPAFVDEMYLTANGRALLPKLTIGTCMIV